MMAVVVGVVMAAVLWDGRVDLMAELVNGLPTWRSVPPADVATRRQLRAAGLRPGGQ